MQNKVIVRVRFGDKLEAQFSAGRAELKTANLKNPPRRKSARHPARLGGLGERRFAVPQLGPVGSAPRVFPKNVMEEEFLRWQQALERLPDFWAVRWVRGPSGGVFWRNCATRDHYQSAGFFPARIMPWHSLGAHMDAATIRELEAIHARVFRERKVRHTFTFQVPGFPARRLSQLFMHGGGDLQDGLVICHWQHPGEVR